MEYLHCKECRKILKEHFFKIAYFSQGRDVFVYPKDSFMQILEVLKKRLCEKCKKLNITDVFKKVPFYNRLTETYHYDSAHFFGLIKAVGLNPDFETRRIMLHFEKF